MNIRATQGVIVGALCGLAGVILVAGLALVVLPQHSHVGRLHDQTAAAKEQLTSMRAEALPTSPQHTSVHAADLFRLSEAMPDNDRMPTILDQLSSLAHSSSLAITSIKPSSAVPLTGYSAIPFAITVAGKYSDLTRFTKRLHDIVRASSNRLVVSGRLFDVNQVMITSADGRTVSATLNIDAFDYVPSAPVAASGTATTSTTPTPGGST